MRFPAELDMTPFLSSSSASPTSSLNSKRDQAPSNHTHPMQNHALLDLTFGQVFPDAKALPTTSPDNVHGVSSGEVQSPICTDTETIAINAIDTDGGDWQSDYNRRKEMSSHDLGRAIGDTYTQLMPVKSNLFGGIADISSVPPAPSAMSQDNNSDEHWQCHKCTFSNSPLLGECEMCGTQRLVSDLSVNDSGVCSDLEISASPRPVYPSDHCGAPNSTPLSGNNNEKEAGTGEAVVFRETSSSSSVYELAAVVRHVGEGAMAGHYICDSKRSQSSNPGSKVWCRCDDAYVSHVTEVTFSL